MTISFRCDGCGQLYRVGPESAGRSAICRHCGARMTAPAADASAAVDSPRRIAPEREPPPASPPVPNVGFPQLPVITLPTDASQTPATGRDANDLAPDHVAEWIERRLGPIAGHYRDPRPQATGLGVARVPPTDERPWTTLVTVGMSRRPMNVPPDLNVPARIELALGLPATWPLDEADLRHGANYWPIQLLQTLAALPASGSTWLGAGHLIPNGDPPRPYVTDSPFVACALLPPIRLPADLSPAFPQPGVRVDVLAVIPLHAAEWRLSVDRGLPALLKRLDRANVSEVFDPVRPTA